MLSGKDAKVFVAAIAAEEEIKFPISHLGISTIPFTPIIAESSLHRQKRSRPPNSEGTSA